MHKRFTARFVALVAFALLVIAPVLAGCGGPGKEDTAGGNYYPGAMKGKGAPAGGKTGAKTPSGNAGAQ